MGAVYDEFVREMAGWQRRFAGQPRREMIHLFLLALEREELVSVSYREEAIRRRLDTMPLSKEVREVIRHALLWVWKDEEMHSIYIRGAILKLGNLRLRLTAFLRQWAGAVGGWSSSVTHHARWSKAPLSRAVAAVNIYVGSLAGKVPADAKEFLRYGPFGDFCRFNMDAEQTAWVCWQRIVELASAQPDLPATLIEDFRRIMNDEDRHGRVFTLLAEALDEQDRLVPGVTIEGLVARIGAVGEDFLPREFRSAGTWANNPIGSGGQVHVVQGRTAEEKVLLFRELLRRAGLQQSLQARAQLLGKSVSRLQVVIKPTFMVGYHRKDRSHISDPVLLEELAKWLREQGVAGVTAVESRNMYDWYYARRSVREVAEYFGYQSPHYELRDLSEEQEPHDYGRGLAQHTIGRTWKEADFRISLARLRSHPFDMVHLSVNNVESLGTRWDEFFFTERQADQETAVMMVLDEFPPHFAIAEGYDQAADGVVGFLGCARPKTPHRMYAALDALSLDLVVGEHLGLRNPSDSRMLHAACHWFGDPRPRIQVVGPDEPVRGWRNPYHTEIDTFMSFFAHPVYQFGSGRGKLFVPQMDEQAFPPLRSEGRALRLTRRLLQMLLGWNHRRSDYQTLTDPAATGAAAPRQSAYP